MSRKNKINRRDFLKTVGAAGLTSISVSSDAFAKPMDPNAPQAKARVGKEVKEVVLPQVPRRQLGKTGVKVPILALGGTNFTDKQIVLKRALDFGVWYWDTAYQYSNGKSEQGIGLFLAKNKDIRKHIFLVTKTSRTEKVGEMEERLQTSLERMQTSYVDLLFWHGLSEPAHLTDELKAFAQSCKDRGLIKFYGFSTHSNVACLNAAAKLDWIDVIMTSYNFRLIQDAAMQSAIDACYKAGIGLVAMKFQAKGPMTEADNKLLQHFVTRGFTVEQAKLKAIWQDERIASICVAMPTIAILGTNVAAALDKTKLTQADMEVFKEYAEATCTGYCAGCGQICNPVVPGIACISDVMRYLMYYNNYGDKEHARELFARLSEETRSRLRNADYSLAEARCPQHLPIAELMAEAVHKLA